MTSRREFLGAIGSLSAGTLAGCTAVGSSVDTYRDAIPSVVGLRVYDENGPRGQGSGFLTDIKGLSTDPSTAPADDVIVTNDHVVVGASAVEVRFRENEWRSAELLATDPYSDLAVLSVTDPPGDPTPLEFVSADPEPPVGTEVLALGSPLGFSGSASDGIISGIDRLLPAPNEFLIADAVQTDAPLNPGNSGGPLVTRDGEVVAVVSAGVGNDVGFGISAALSARVLPALHDRGRYKHPFVGVRTLEVTPSIADVYDQEVKGVLVVEVLQDGPAAGTLQGTNGETTERGVPVPTGGDVIVGVDETVVETQADFAGYLTLETSPGDEVEITIVRDGTRRVVSMVLGERPPPRR